MQAAREVWGASVSREDVFYATYALLHHPAYRAKYGENLKRELPRLPLDALVGTWPAMSGVSAGDGESVDSPDMAGHVPTLFSKLVEIGRKLGDLHVGYESATPFDFEVQDTTQAGTSFSFRVEKMRFDKEKTSLKVNDSILLSGFTPEMFAYKLGNRSALDWVVESYRVKRDERSGLTSDPNREDEPRFILDLIGKVATVSLETQKLVEQLPILLGDTAPA